MINRIKHILIGGKTSLLHIQLIRYLVAGSVAFAIDFIILKTFTENLGFHYLSSAVIGYCFGLLTSYLLSVLWVFDKRRMANRMVELASFIIIGVIGLGLTYMFMWLLTDIADIYYLLSKIITTVLVFFWNFFAKKFLLFSK